LLDGKRVKVGIGVAESFVDTFEFGMEIHNFLYTFGDDVAHGFARLEMGFLRQIADGIARSASHFARIFGVKACHDAQERRFARAVQAYDANLGAIEIREAYILEYLFGSVSP